MKKYLLLLAVMCLFALPAAAQVEWSTQPEAAPSGTNTFLFRAGAGSYKTRQWTNLLSDIETGLGIGTMAAETAADYTDTAGLTTLLADKQDADADLDTYAGITPSANIQTILGAADYAAVRTALTLVIGTDVQEYDADLTTYAGITPSANIQTLLGAADYAAAVDALDLVIGTNTQAYDADLAAIAGLTSAADKGIQFTGAGTAAVYDLTAAGKALLDDAAASNQRTTLGFRANEYCYALSDFNTTAVTAAEGLAIEYLPAAFTVTGVRAYTRTAPTGLMTIDINEVTTSILSTKLTIDADEKTSGLATTAAVISDTAIAANAEIKIDVDSTTGGKGLVVCLEGTF